jgi:hypothetical protein
MNNIPTAVRYDLPARIGVFLISKGRSSWGHWEGRMSKFEQDQAFGLYLGKGLIVVDGSEETIVSVVKVCFGQDSMAMRGVDCKAGTYFDNDINGVLNRHFRESPQQ